MAQTPRAFNIQQGPSLIKKDLDALEEKFIKLSRSKPYRSDRALEIELKRLLLELAEIQQRFEQVQAEQHHNDQQLMQENQRSIERLSHYTDLGYLKVDTKPAPTIVAEKSPEPQPKVQATPEPSHAEPVENTQAKSTAPTPMGMRFGQTPSLRRD